MSPAPHPLGIVPAPSVAVKVRSFTGAQVVDYWSTVQRNDALSIELLYKKVGGLNTFQFTLANDIDDPLFPGMTCEFFVNGDHWGTGYADIIPGADTDTAGIVITGKGFVHKLKNLVINETYTAQTIDAIIKDVASTYLTPDLQVLYDVAKIQTPTITGIDIEFKDKRLDQVFDSLLEICNTSYATAQYRYFVDKDRYLNFELISTDDVAIYYEGFDYQSPEVETINNKLVNKILAYRTEVADPKAVEYVATYSDADSITNNGEQAEKLTFPDYATTLTIKNISDSIIAQYKDPFTKIQISNLPITEVPEFGFYRIVNKRQRFFQDVATFESLTNWNTTGMATTVPTISDAHVFTGRAALKLVTASGSDGEIMFKNISPIISFPTVFKFNAYLDNIVAVGEADVIISDTFGNIITLPVGQNNEPSGQWLKYTVLIDIINETALLAVDIDGSTSGLMLVDIDISTSGNLRLQKLLQAGILNLDKVTVEAKTDLVTEMYFDQFSVESVSYKQHTLILEEAALSLGRSQLTALVLGDSSDSIIKEINDETAAGKAALEVFSKQ